jgi:hypothetical protein
MGEGSYPEPIELRCNTSMAERDEDRHGPEKRSVREIIDEGIAGTNRLCGRERQVCEDWLQFILTSVKPWPGRPLDEERGDQILVALLARSTNTFWVSIELARIGFGEQAIMLNRSLFEDMVDAHWVTLEPELARDRFEQHFRHSQMLFADAARQHPERFAEDDVPFLDETDRPELAKIFGDYGHKSWTGVDMHRRVESIEHLWTNEDDQKVLHFFRRIVYRDSNQQLHPSAQALNDLVRSSSETELGLKVGPGPEGVRRSLWSAYWLSVQIVSLVFQHFEFPDELQDRMRTLVHRGQSAFHQLSEDDLRGIERNDLCPCGSGLKYKRCHGA